MKLDKFFQTRVGDDGDDDGDDGDDDDDVTEAPTPQRGGERQRAQRLRARSRASPLL